MKDLSLPEQGSVRRLGQLLPLLPNLIHLDVPSLPELNLSPEAYISTDPPLSRLTRLSVSFGRVGSKTDIENLSPFAALPLLQQLKVYRFDESSLDSVLQSATALPQITQLAIEGTAADTESIRALVDSCPSLLHLDLHSTYPGSTVWEVALSHLPTTLQSLHLCGKGYFVRPFDHLLVRFVQLRSIRLGDRCYSSTIHTALVQLPLLTHIHLGSGSLDPVGCHALVTGATRLLSLQTIPLDFYTLQEGERRQRRSKIVHGVNEENGGLDIEMRDWRFPAEWSGAPLNVGAYEELDSIAKENGIVIDGTIKVALNWCRNYHLESNNRAVLDAYHRQYLTHLRQIRSSAAQAGVTLPNIDFDSLDTNRLEIVEIDLPGQGWWALSLRSTEQPC